MSKERIDDYQWGDECRKCPDCCRCNYDNVNWIARYNSNREDINLEIQDIMRGLNFIGLKYNDNMPQDLYDAMATIHTELMQIKGKYYVD